MSVWLTVSPEDPYLQTIAIELTNYCNLQCEPCYGQNPRLYKARSKGYMTLENFRVLLEQLKMLPKLRILNLSYNGESLLHPQFELMAQEARAALPNMMIGIVTNATLITRSKAFAILKNCNSIIVSMHHGPKLDEALNGLETLSTINQQAKNPRSLFVNVMADEFKHHEVIALADRVKERKIVVQFRRGWPMTEDLKTPMQHPQTTTTWTDVPAPFHSDKFCLAPFYYTAVLWNGDTLPCCHILNGGDFSLGNVFNTSLLDVWNGQAYGRLRNENYEPSCPCVACEVRELPV